jgi:hypothetical protein
MEGLEKQNTDLRDPEPSVESGELREDALMHSTHNNDEQGLNCSSRHIYNIVMSGKRVTRNNLRQEEILPHNTKPKGNQKPPHIGNGHEKTVAAAPFRDHKKPNKAKEMIDIKTKGL